MKTQVLIFNLKTMLSTIELGSILMCDVLFHVHYDSLGPVEIIKSSFLT